MIHLLQRGSLQPILVQPPLSRSLTLPGPNKLRCVSVSDTHTRHRRLHLPPGDVLSNQIQQLRASGEGASVAHSVLFPGAEVGEKVSLERCIVGPNALAVSPGGERCIESVFLKGQPSPDSF